MDMLNIFENPWLLISLAAFLLIAAGVCRQVRPEWGYWPLLAAALAAGLGLGLDRLVQTDKEKIVAVIDACRRSAAASSARGFEPMIADNYSDAVHPDRQSLLNDAERILSRIVFHRIQVKSHTIRIEGRRAQSDLRLRVFMDPQRSDYPLAGGLMLVSMGLDYAKNAEDRWQITRVELRSVNDATVDWGDAR